MARRRRRAADEREQQGHHRVRRAAGETATRRATLPGGPIPFAGGGSREGQAALLSSGHLPGIQRHALASQIGRVQGNRHLQRVLAPRRREGEPAGLIQRQRGRTGPTSPLIPEIWDRLASWMKQGPRAALNRNPALRNVLLTLYARLGPLWSHVKRITWVGERGEMLFEPQDDGRLQTALLASGYTASYFAKGGKDRWGLREPNVETAGLHWRGKSGGKVEVHIDLHPPILTGLWHKIQDDWRRSTTHTPESLRAGVESLGTYIPVLFQQRIHGLLVVRFNELAGRAQGRANVLAAIGRGRQHLRAAARIIWTRAVVSQADLRNALFSLYQAGREATRAANLLRGART